MGAYNLPKNPAVYSIINTIAQKKYIGSTKNVLRRWSKHKAKLNKGNHPNRYLQRDWQRYGEEAFKVDVLESLEGRPEDLVEREQLCLDKFKPEYNISPTAGSTRGIKYSKESRQSISSSRRGEKNPNSTLTEDQVKEIRSLYEAELMDRRDLAAEYGVGYEAIGKIIRRVTWRHV